LAPQLELKTLFGGCTHRPSALQQPAQVAGLQVELEPPPPPEGVPPADPPPVALEMPHWPARQLIPMPQAAHWFPPRPHAVTPSPRSHMPAAVQHPSAQFDGPHVGIGMLQLDAPTNSPSTVPTTTRMCPPAAGLYAK
jgi:hypothetical protein